MIADLDRKIKGFNGLDFLYEATIHLSWYKTVAWRTLKWDFLKFVIITGEH